MPWLAVTEAIIVEESEKLGIVLGIIDQYQEQHLYLRNVWIAISTHYIETHVNLTSKLSDHIHELKEVIIPLN